MANSVDPDCWVYIVCQDLSVQKTHYGKQNQNIKHNIISRSIFCLILNTSCSLLGTKISGIELGLVWPGVKIMWLGGVLGWVWPRGGYLPTKLEHVFFGPQPHSRQYLDSCAIPETVKTPLPMIKGVENSTPIPDRSLKHYPTADNDFT